MTPTDLLLAALFFVIATLYSSVGHAGATGYLAAMALMSSPRRWSAHRAGAEPPGRGHRLRRFLAGLVASRMVLPFVVASAPAAYFAAQYPIPKESYALLLGSLLLVSAIAVFRSAAAVAANDEALPLRPLRWPPALLAGAAIGGLSGLTGTGGAIFLTPLLLLMHWTHSREAGGVSVAFVWINSALGLAGLSEGHRHAAGGPALVAGGGGPGRPAGHPAGHPPAAAQGPALCAFRGAADRGGELALV